MKGITAIITAGGSGTRMGADTSKLFLEIDGKMIIRRTIEQFDKLEIIDDLIIVIRECDVDLYKQEIMKDIKKPFKLIIGGKTREESTYNGIKHLDDKCDIVVCHDGARPFIKSKYIIKAIDAMVQYSGAIVAVPAKDTIKYVDCDGVVENTPERARLYMVQTPQVFRKDDIVEAYEYCMTNNVISTDDASMLEAMGKKVKIIPGEYSNIKITTPEDLAIGEIFLKQGDNSEN